MQNDDLIPLIVALVIGVVGLAIYIGLIVLGVTIAKRKNRSPHWMWFAIHPLGLLIVLIVMAALSPLKRCPQCSQTTPQYARICGMCGYNYVMPGAFAQPQQPIYIPPQR